jgi:hypothetical protein
MQQPRISGYRIEYVDVPAPKDEAQIVREVLGASPPTPPPGPPTRLLRIITVEGSRFPITETPFEVRIGDQVLQSLAIIGPGTGARGMLQHRPQEGDEIAIHVAEPESTDPQILVAGVFDPRS